MENNKRITEYGFMVTNKKNGFSRSVKVKAYDFVSAWKQLDNKFPNAQFDQLLVERNGKNVV